MEQKILVASKPGKHYNCFAATRQGLDLAVTHMLETGQTIVIQGVLTCSWHSGDELCFGDLHDRELISKDYIPAGWGDLDMGCHIEWIVLENIIIIDERGDRFERGDEILWEK